MSSTEMSPDEDPESWLRRLFPSYVADRHGEPIDLADHHRDFWTWVWTISSGIRPRPFVAVWPRGGGKCYHGDVEILCADGTRKPIRDIRPGDVILSLNEATGRFERDVIARHWVSGTKPCLTIKTRTGKSVSLTAEHKVLTFEGWKTAGELTLVDRIAAPRRTPIEPDEIRSDEEVRLLAYIVAEGSCSSGNTKFTNADSAIVEDFTACVKAMGMRIRPSGKYGYSLAGARPWFRSMGVDGCTAKTKRIPAWVYRLPERQKWEFLAAMVDTDGWITPARGRVAITLANEALVNDLVYLFLQVGVVCSVAFKPNHYDGAWEVRVDQDAVTRCAELMPLRLKADRLREAASTLRYSLLDTYPSSVTRDLPFRASRMIRNTTGTRTGTPYALTREKMRRLIEAYPHERWRWLEQADVFWDQISSIEPAGEHETYDVEVAKNHNLIGNGLVAHNSTGAELACVAVGARRTRRYVLYVSSTQAQADDHVANIGSLLESESVGRLYPQLAERSVGKYGSSRGWRRNRLRTAAGFTVDALGLDTAARGVKLDEARPDMIVLDDIDDAIDTAETTRKKIIAITQKLLPAGSTDAATLAVQNIVHHDGVFARLANVATDPADFLADRIVSGPHPALRGFQVEKQADGRWLITSGIATWAGQSVEICQQQINDWGIRAFRAEAQHERTPPEGQAFPEFDPSVHVVDPFPIPAAWPKWRMVDWGYAAPFCALWMAREPSGRIVVYRELYGAGISTQQQALQVNYASVGERYFTSVGDPSMWASTREGQRFKSAAQLYAEGGVILMKASNDRVIGWQRLHDLLDWSEEAPPNLVIFRATTTADGRKLGCPNLIRTLPLLTQDPNKPEDVDSDCDDHAPDACRYGIMAAHWLDSARRPKARTVRMGA